MTIGDRRFTSRLIQGPLAGYSCAPMRVQTWKYSRPAFCATEMVSAVHLVNAKKTENRYIYRHPDEGPLSFQLSGNDPKIVGQATRKITELIAPEIIELNCGCPVAKIRAKNAGSKLLTQTENLTAIIKEMKNNTDAVITIKIRVEGDVGDHNNIEVAQMIESAGADAIVVHGRHWMERYDVPCRYDQIAEIVNAVTIPVIGNGDVDDLESVKRMINQTHCAGIMISRASVGQPWIFAQLAAEARGEAFKVPSITNVASLFIEHIEHLEGLEGEFRAVLQARKLGKYYARDLLADKAVFLDQLMACESLKTLKNVVKEFFVG